MARIFRVEAIEPNRRVICERDVVENIGLSISRHGQLKPILIYQQGVRFLIIDGEKRWRAVKWLGQRTIIAEIEK
ncbi:MAG: ParB N-terminal domain-containing protein [Desulfovermiculus sp.]